VSKEQDAFHDPATAAQAQYESPSSAEGTKSSIVHETVPHYRGAQRSVAILAMKEIMVLGESPMNSIQPV